MHTAFTPFATSFATWLYKRESNCDITRTKGEWRGDARLHRRLPVQNGSSWYTRDFPNPVDRVCGRWTEYVDGGRSVDGVCGWWTECRRCMRTVDGVWTAYVDSGRSADSVCRWWMECGQRIRKVDRVRNDNDKWLWADSEWNGSKWMTVEIDHLESRSHTVTHKVRWAQYSYDFNTWRHLIVNRLSFMR